MGVPGSDGGRICPTPGGGRSNKHPPVHPLVVRVRNGVASIRFLPNTNSRCTVEIFAHSHDIYLFTFPHMPSMISRN